MPQILTRPGYENLEGCQLPADLESEIWYEARSHSTSIGNRNRKSVKCESDL